MPEDAPAPDQDTQAPEERGLQTEGEQPESQETPAPESPEDSPADSGFKERYEQLRPEYTRATQRLSELERFVGYLQDPQTQDQALAALGYEVEGEEPDEELEPTDELAQRLERMEQFLQSRADSEVQAETQALEAEWVDRELKRVTKDASLSDEEQRVVRDLADRYRDDDDIPDVEAAHEAFKSALEVGTKRYRESKRSQKVETGQAGLDKVNLADDEERQAHMAAVMQAAAELES